MLIAATSTATAHDDHCQASSLRQRGCIMAWRWSHGTAATMLGWSNCLPRKKRGCR